MSPSKYDRSLSVNIREFDKQHIELFKLIDNLHDVIREGNPDDIIKKTMKGLMDYTTIHFSTEEKYFDLYKYPDAESHKEEHRYFTKKAYEFNNQNSEDEIKMATRILHFLEDWLINHIKVSDKKYTSFFNDKGLK